VSVADEIRRRMAAFAPSRLELHDQSAQHAGHAGAAPGGNTHWRLTIVSDAFRGKSSLARHRMIYEALGDLMQNPIHAIELNARVPGENDA